MLKEHGLHNQMQCPRYLILTSFGVIVWIALAVLPRPLTNAQLQSSRSMNSVSQIVAGFLSERTELNWSTVVVATLIADSTVRHFDKHYPWRLDYI